MSRRLTTCSTCRTRSNITIARISLYRAPKCMSSQIESRIHIAFASVVAFLIWLFTAGDNPEATTFRCRSAS